MLGRLFERIEKHDPYSITGRNGFVTRSDMELLVAKERARCDRGAQPFRFVVFKLLPSKHGLTGSMVKLARLISDRVRLTDERAVWSADQIALLLPQTDRLGLQVVLESLTKQAANREIYFDVQTFQYPNESHFDSDDSSVAGNADSEDSISDDSSTTVEVYPSSVAREAISSSIALYLADYPTWKRQIDVCSAVVGLVATSPLIAMAAVAIKLNSPGPVFFKQKRTGYHGRVFEMYKLRSMVITADEQKSALMELNERDGPAFKIANDPRVTFVGRILRATGMDEIPQLWNVLRGDMALVGPRPLPCDEDAQCLSWQRRRLETKPGLTCYWQTSKSRRVSFSDWMRMDLRYYSRRSFVQDSYIVVRTVMAVFLGRVGH
jgi:lipopolysaccharide/colanic/teichoic acid biosynthesis glycosyltransferase